MNIFVLIKQAPDTEASIKIAGNSIQESGIKWIVSSLDDYAMEEALRLKEKTGGTITALTFGPERATDVLRTAYSLGADHAVHLKDDHSSLDVSYAAFVIATYLKSKSPDMIFAGDISGDSQSSMLPVMVAAHLNIPSIIQAIEVQVDKNEVKVKREVDGGTGIIQTSLPVVITATKNLNTPRYPSLKGVMAAKKKPIETLPAEEFASGSPSIEVLSFELLPSRPPARIIEGADVKDKVHKLVKLLKEEARVI